MILEIEHAQDLLSHSDSLHAPGAEETLRGPCKVDQLHVAVSIVRADPRESCPYFATVAFENLQESSITEREDPRNLVALVVVS